jgi:transposase
MDAAGTTTWVGIDVSKDTLDACQLGPGDRPRQRAFPNTTAGFRRLAAWAAPAARFCLESTGAYGRGLADHLAAAGRHVSVVNPARVRYAGLMRGQGNKTDAADARPIAEYAARESPPAYAPPRPGVRQLQALTRRRDDLRAAAAREKGRLAAPGLTPAERASIRRTARFLAREADRVQAEADALIGGCPDLRADRDLLASVGGIGPQTASTVLAELPDREAGRSAQSAAAYAGLAPREYRSGSSVRKRTRLSKAGNGRLRKALFLPTLTAIRFDPVLASFYERLTAAGKPRMAAVGACMRKLLMICYGVLRTRTPFDPAWAVNKTR